MKYQTHSMATRVQAIHHRGLKLGLGGSLVLALAACASAPNRAPVENRVATAVQAAAPVSAPSSQAPPVVEAVKPLSGLENAGKPGYYTVKPGDTLIRVGLENGQNWKDLVRWNALENPNIIEVGQVLRVVAPGVDAGAAATRAVTAGRIETRPLEPRAAGSAGTGSVAATTPVASPAAPVAAAPAPAAAPAAAPIPREGAEDDINWAWPAAGSVAGNFEEGKSKGLVIAGRAGEPVLAAADGRVVYAGSGLRGYGNLVILKHNNTYLTAYAHNQALLVKEDQAVKRGQKIAEMGSTDAERVQLHFEIRRLGKPIDPSRLLPAR